MVGAKASKKKKQQQKKPGIDFKKIKRKIGRKLPPPNNATNTKITFKAIVLPEQSVAADKAGHAVSKKGLTLKELLQQSSHHNPKVRKDALQGIQDLLGKHPAELKLHKIALVEKLRERIGDNNESVRKALYQLFKSVIFPGCKEDYQGPLVALVMSYIFHAMAHLAIDVQLMAFKFFDLVVQYYPPSFVLHAEKILQNYKSLLLKNELYRQDKGNLKCSLEGLVRCLSLLPSNDKEEDPCEREVVEQISLHEYQVKTSTVDHSDLSPKLKDLMLVLINCFKEIFSVVHEMPSLEDQSFDCLQYTLQSIDIIIKILICQLKKDKKIQCYSGGSNTNIWDKTVVSMLTTQLLEKFPISSVHHFSAKDDARYFTLNIVLSEIFLNLRECIDPPPYVSEKFFQFIESCLIGKKPNGKHARLAVPEKHIESLLRYIPRLVSHVSDFWKSRLLQAFTDAFMNCKPASSMKLACLSTIKKMLIPYYEDTYLDGNDQDILKYQIRWIRELVPLLMELGDKHPSSSKILLRLLLYVGQTAQVNPSIVSEYDNLQRPLEAFFSTDLGDGNISYGPFTKLPSVCHEHTINGLYYFSRMGTSLLKSIAACCLCENLAQDTFFRIVDVVESIFKNRHLSDADYIGFFLRLLRRLKVNNENIERSGSISDWETLLKATRTACRCLLNIGDKSVVLQLVEEAVCDQLKSEVPRQNACALLKVISALDSKPSRLSEESISVLANFLPVYLEDVIQGIPVIEGKDGESDLRNVRIYCIRPCFNLFDTNSRLVSLFLDSMGSAQTNNGAAATINRISGLVSALQLMHDYKYERFRRVLSPFKGKIEEILENMTSLVQGGGEENKVVMTLEDKHIAERACNHLREILHSIG